MARSRAALILILLLTGRVNAISNTLDADVSASAEATILHDYLEWVHTPKLAGPCADVPVVRVKWVNPEGVVGTRPVLWVKADGRFGAILGLSHSQTRSIGRSVPAQPVLVLRDVSIFRLCRPWSRSDRQ